ncbi:hypothetical protein PN499_06420 [Kamptonema animale CS-326]|nr:hypothetical protein [Kamptonema animale]MDB9510810.1 hypothetical protein [Kamptonema animale CS-326]
MSEKIGQLIIAEIRDRTKIVQDLRAIAVRPPTGAASLPPR